MLEMLMIEPPLGLLISHHATCGLGHEEEPLEVDVEDRVPVFLGDIERGPGGR